MEYRAAAAVPHLDAERAVSGLRSQLRLQADVDSATVDWATLRVTGPAEVVDAHAQVFYEWTATVRATAPAGAQDARKLAVID